MAEEHWSRDEYKQWLFDSVWVQQIPYDIVSDTFPYWDRVRMEWVYFSHHLPDKKTQEYYEMIGKYDQFRWGWDDYEDATKSSQHRQSYLECLAEAGMNGKSVPTVPE